MRAINPSFLAELSRENAMSTIATALLTLVTLLLSGTAFAGSLTHASNAKNLSPEIVKWLEEQPEFFRIDDMLFRKSSVMKLGFTGQKWPNGVLYYHFDDSISEDDKQIVRATIGAWSQSARVSFVESASAANRVRIFDDSACYSEVGFQGGVQSMSLGAGCFGPMTILHEFGHALGMQHEQSRSDRDSFVEILQENIKPAELHNFARRDTVNYTPYDYYSIMHYGVCTFAANCSAGPSLRALPINRICTNPPEHPLPGQERPCDFAMGNREFLTRFDSFDMAYHYGTNLSVDFAGRAGSFTLSVGGTNCADDCTIAVPFGQQVAIRQVGQGPAVIVGGCRLEPDGVCMQATSPGNLRIRAIRAADAWSAITSAANGQQERIFSSGFE